MRSALLTLGQNFFHRGECSRLSRAAGTERDRTEFGRMRVERLARDAQLLGALGRLRREKFKTERYLEWLGHKNFTCQKKRTTGRRKRKGFAETAEVKPDFLEFFAPSAKPLRTLRPEVRIGFIPAACAEPDHADQRALLPSLHAPHAGRGFRCAVCVWAGCVPVRQ